jgi:hypothetical protein
VVDDIKMELKEIVWKGIECFDLVHRRNELWDFVNTMMNFQGPINYAEFLEWPRKNFLPQKKNC